MMKRFLFLTVLTLFVSFSLAFAAGSQPTQPSITVLSPNGGENLVTGQTYNITWQSFGLSQVNINLWSWESVSNGYRVSVIAKNLNASQGSYSWVIPEKTECSSLPCLSLPEFSYHKIQVVDSGYGRNNPVSKVISDESNAFRVEVSPPSPPSPPKMRVGEWISIVCGLSTTSNWLNITLDPKQWNIKNVKILSTTKENATIDVPFPSIPAKEASIIYHGVRQECNGFIAEIPPKDANISIVSFDVAPKTSGFLKIHYVYGGKQRIEGDWLYEGISSTLSGAAPKMAKNGATTWGKIKS